MHLVHLPRCASAQNKIFGGKFIVLYVLTDVDPVFDILSLVESLLGLPT